MLRWDRLKTKGLLGIGAAVAGAAILIISLPSWIWMFAMGGFLIWFGLSMLSVYR